MSALASASFMPIKRFTKSPGIASPSSLSVVGSGLGEDGTDPAEAVGVFDGVDFESMLPVGLGVADWLELGDCDALGATMSELSEFEIAGMAKTARKRALIAAINPHCRGFTFAPFARFDHNTRSGLDSRPCPDFSGSCVLWSE